MKRRILSLLLAVTVLATSLYGVLPSLVSGDTLTNLFTNGDFGQNNGTIPTGWTLTGAGASSSIDSSDVPTAGTNALVVNTSSTENAFFYSTNAVKIEKNTEYTISFWVKDKNVAGIRFYLYEPGTVYKNNGTPHTGVAPAEGTNLYSYATTSQTLRNSRTDILHNIYVDNANAYALSTKNSMAIVRGTVNGEKDKPLLLTSDFDGTDACQAGTDAWVRVVHTFTTGSDSAHEANVSYGIRIPATEGGQVAFANFEMYADPIPEKFTPKVANPDLGYTLETEVAVGKDATFTAVPLNGAKFDGWYENSTATAQKLSSDPSYTFKFIESATVNSPRNYEARFKQGDNYVYTTSFEEGYTVGEKIVAFESGGIYTTSRTDEPNCYWDVASTYAISWQNIKVTAEAHSGKKSININTRSSWAGFKPSVTLEKNTDYTVSFFFLLASSNTHISSVYVMGKDGNPIENNKIISATNEKVLGSSAIKTYSNGFWTEKTVNFNTGDNTEISIWIRAYGDDNKQTYIDSFSIYQSNNVAVSAELGGTATVEPSGLVPKGNPVTYTAEPYNGNTFAGWYDGSTKVSDQAAYTFVPAGDITLTAKFDGPNKPGSDVFAANGMDGTFENGEIPTWYAYDEKWSVSWCSYSRVNIANSKDAVYEGNYGLSINARQRTSILPLENLKEYTDYKFSFYYNFPTNIIDDRDKIPSMAIVLDGAKTVADSTNIAAQIKNLSVNSGWNQITFYFNTGNSTSANFLLRFETEVTTLRFYMDNISLVEYLSAEEVTNGTFDTSADGWIGDYNYNAADKAITVDATDKYIYQNIKVAKSTPYKVSFRAKGNFFAAATPVAEQGKDFPTIYNSISSDSCVTGNSADYQNYSYNVYSGIHPAISLGFISLDGAASIDDVVIEKIDETSGAVIENVGFESDRFQLKNSDTDKWSIYTATSANDTNVHSGSKSLKFTYNKNDSESEHILMEEFLGAQLENGIAYKLTVWYKMVDGKTGGSVYIAPDFQGSYGANVGFTYDSDNKDWKKAVFGFVAANTLSVKTLIKAVATGTAGDIYFDDISLVVSAPMLTDEKTRYTYGEELYNVVENSNFENAVTEKDWVGLQSTQKIVSGNALKGSNYLQNNSGTKYVLKVPVVAGAEYNFGVSMRASEGTVAYTGLTISDNFEKDSSWYCDDSGVPNSRIAVTEADGQWHRNGYQLVAGSTGYIYFVIVVTKGTLDIDSVQLVENRFACWYDPNDYTVYTPYDFEATTSATCIINGGYGPQPYYKAGK